MLTHRPHSQANHMLLSQRIGAARGIGALGALGVLRAPALVRGLSHSAGLDAGELHHAAQHAPLPPASASAPIPIGSVLVANRGEIACRVFRTAKRLGIKTVAVFSDADKDSAHVSMADQAFNIGAAPAQESYLRGSAILEVAALSGAKAIHPGYGFLSEQADFAEACARQGVAFVGPPPSSIRSMGNKSEAKALMSAAGVPVVPGYHGGDQSAEVLRREAEAIGAPIMIKAVLGGGGKGMRLVTDLADFEEKLASARREAAASFGDERVLLERYISRPLHIEVQVFADTHGHVVHLGERDCTLQRREEIGAAAVAAARAVGYVGAGTVEFLVDGGRGDFYFMEMNTRLQVEHPVTELVTGVDLVEWQLRVAAGQPLPASALLGPPEMRGHAFEARIYAESPEAGFLPSSGTLLRYRPPPEGWVARAQGDSLLPGACPGALVRLDSGVREGDQVGVFYDPMLAKLITWAPTRGSALSALHVALGAFQIAGVPTNIRFLRRLASHPLFGPTTHDVDTSWIEREGGEALLGGRAEDLVQTSFAALAAALLPRASAPGPGVPSPFAAGDGWRAAGAAPAPGREVALLPGTRTGGSGGGGGGEERVAARVTPVPGREGAYDVEGPGGGAVRFEDARLAGGELCAEVGGRRVRAAVAGYVVGDEQQIHLFFLQGGDGALCYRIPPPGRRVGQGPPEERGAVCSPMPGRVVKVLVDDGTEVEAGEGVVVVEAMKMEHTLRAPSSGAVSLSSSLAVGLQVGDRDALFSVSSEVAGG